MIGLMIFTGVILLLLGWAMFGVIKQKRCKHEKITGYPNDVGGYVFIKCNKCGLTRRLVMEDLMVGNFVFWNRKVKVTRIVDEKTNTLKMSVEKLYDILN